LVSVASPSFVTPIVNVTVPYGALFRAVISVRTQGKTVRVLTDLVLVGRGRTELTLTVAGPAPAKRRISAAERRLARALISRARA
jgi:hypothetical protein